MTERKSRKLAVFLSNGRGLADWQAVGSLSREVAVYKRLVDLGWSVTFYTYDRTRRVPSVGFPAKVVTQWPYVLPRRLYAVYGALASLVRYPAAADRPRIIITNQAHSGWPAILASRLWGAKLIARCGYLYGEREEVAGHGGLHVKRKKLEERLTFQFAHRCVVPTAELARWLVANYGIDESKVTVIPNYVDTGEFLPFPTKETVDVISVGRLVEKKRHYLLLEALAGTNVSVRIIGKGEWRGRLRSLAAENGVELDLIERVENERLPELLNAAKLYVNLSRWEGHPKAMIEAMACERACVGADSPGIGNLIRHGRTGWLVQPEAEAVRSALLALLADKRQRAEMGAAARAFAEEQFSLDHVSRRYADLFEHLAAE